MRIPILNIEIPFFKKEKPPIEQEEQVLGSFIGFFIDAESNLTIELDSSDDEQMLYDLAVVIYSLMSGQLNMSMVNVIKNSDEDHIQSLLYKLQSLNEEHKKLIQENSDRPLIHPLAVFGASKIIGTNK